VTDLVNVERDGNILQDAVLPSYVLLCCTQSVVLTVKLSWVSSMFVWLGNIFMCFVCFVSKTACSI